VKHSDPDKRAEVGKPAPTPLTLEDLRRLLQQLPLLPQPPPGLERHYRFRDLQELGIVNDWHTLQDWIKKRGFPPGIKVAGKMRIWPASSIQAFLDKRAAEAAA
jgi:hypothetical protein